MTAPGVSSHLFTGVKHRNEAFPHFQPRRYGLTKDQYLAKITPAGQLRKQAQLCRSIYAWRVGLTPKRNIKDKEDWDSVNPDMLYVAIIWLQHLVLKRVINLFTKLAIPN